MKKRVTVNDIAKVLGVSHVTVIKALNGKPRVSEETRNRVLETAKEMGFKVNKVAKSLSRKPIKIGMIISATVPEFLSEVLRGALAAYEELADFNVYFDYYITNQSLATVRQEIFDKIEEMAGKHFDGILLSPPNNIEGFDKIIKRLSERNIFVASVISDLEDTGRIFCIRHNGVLAGKIAANLLNLFTGGGKLAVFSGFEDVEIHKETLKGFMDECKEDKLDIVDVYMNYDLPNRAYEAAGKLLDEHPDVSGIYVNTANSKMVCQKIIERGYDGKIKMVVSDIYPELKDYLKQGVVHASLFQDPFNQSRMAVKKMYMFLEEGAKNVKQDDVLLKPQVVLKSNIDSYIFG